MARIEGINRYTGLHATRELAETAVLTRLSASTHVPTRDTATTKMDEPTSEQRSDTVGPTLRQWSKEFLRRRREAGLHRCMADAKAIFGKWIATADFYDLPLKAITPRDVRAWLLKIIRMKTKNGRLPARQSVVNVMNSLRVCLRDACDEGLIDANPCREVKVPKMPSRQAWTTLTMEELSALAKLPVTTERNAVLFAAFSGCRSGELWGMRWQPDVDLKRRTVTISRNLRGPTKNGKIRTFPLLQQAYEILILQRELTGNRALVFPLPSGRMRSKSNNARIKALLRKAGITRHVRFHDTRHTCCSLLVSGSLGRVWSLHEVQLYVGHESIQSTMRYSHLIGGGLERAVRETMVPAAE